MGDRYSENSDSAASVKKLQGVKKRWKDCVGITN